MNKKDETISIFWCDLLHPIIFGEVADREVNQFLKELSTKFHRFPDGTLKKVSLSTLRRKLNKYEEQGFMGMQRKNRNDRGKIRSVPQEILDKAIELKKDQPLRAEDTINRFLKHEFGKTIPKSTLYRHLRRSGATKIKLGISKKKVRKRWTRDHSNELWIGDFETGPYVIYEGNVVGTNLSLFIDCHSRYVVEGRYYLRKSLDILIDSLLRVWSIHGASADLYLDNAKVYHANALKAACYQLNINLLHRTKGDPSPGGLVERYFGTCQSQFEAEVKAGDILTLNQLNKAFSAYLAVAYHEREHSETKEAPRHRFEKGLIVKKSVNINEVRRFFMSEVERTVHKDFSDVRIDSVFYRVSPKLRGDRVKVLWDPFGDQDIVYINSLHDEYLGKGTRYERNYGEEIDTPNQGKPKHNYLDLLNSLHEEQMKTRSQGIDYRKVIEKHPWSFNSFVQTLAKLMGRSKNIASFSSEELEDLNKAYNSCPSLNEKIVMKAWEEAANKNIHDLILQLYVMNTKGE